MVGGVVAAEWLTNRGPVPPGVDQWEAATCDADADRFSASPPMPAVAQGGVAGGRRGRGGCEKLRLRLEGVEGVE